MYRTESGLTALVCKAGLGFPARQWSGLQFHCVYVLVVVKTDFAEGGKKNLLSPQMCDAALVSPHKGDGGYGLPAINWLECPIQASRL